MLTQKIQVDIVLHQESHFGRLSTCYISVAAMPLSPCALVQCTACTTIHDSSRLNRTQTPEPGCWGESPAPEQLHYMSIDLY